MNVEWLLKGEPREVQLEALRRSFYGYKLRDHKDDSGNRVMLRPNGMPAVGWGHLMEMRLGKTPTILNEFALARKHFGFHNLICIVPNAYKEDWALEAEKYGLPVPAMAYEQSKLARAIDFVEKAKKGWALFVNYESIYYDQTLAFLGPLVTNLTYIGSDESIKLKNHEGLFFKGAMLLAKNAGMKRIATGLPITQGPQDFYAQGRFIGMYSGKSFYAYRGKYCKMGGYKSKKIVAPKNEDQLNAEINANAFVAKRRDWGRQTPAQYFNLRVKPVPEQMKHYNEMNSDLVTMLGDGTIVTAEQVMGKMMKLQQISSGFIYDEDGKARLIMDPKKTPKMRRLIEFANEELVGKLVVPYYYSETGRVLREAMADFNPAVIAGKGTINELETDVVSEKKRFNHDPSCRVVFVQISAGKYGHDLSGNADARSRTTIFYENSYSLDDRQQIEARNTTAFQDWENIYFDMISTAIEAKAVEALVLKENVAERVLGAYRDNKTRQDIL